MNRCDKSTKDILQKIIDTIEDFEYDWEEDEYEYESGYNKAISDVIEYIKGKIDELES